MSATSMDFKVDAMDKKAIRADVRALRKTVAQLKRLTKRYDIQSIADRIGELVRDVDEQVERIERALKD